jgi:competence protein ComEC
MLGWIPFAFIRIVVFFGAGILVALYQPEILLEPASYLIFLSCCVLYLVFVFARSRLKINPGIAGMLAIFFAGYCNVRLQTDSRRPAHLNHLTIPVEYYTAVITLPADERERSWKISARIAEVKTSMGWAQRSGNVLIYLPKADFPRPFSNGDKILVKGAPQPVKAPANPGEFDYRNFLANRHIHHQHYIRGEQVKFLNHTSPNWVQQHAHAARTWADGLLKTYIHGEREQALASALVLGVTDGLDSELLNAYSATGTLHVLAVSGLHVGIIYWMILIVFRPLQRHESSKWILSALSLLILWAYALVTGLSPSVLRAVTMFSFMALARPWNQRTNIYNILAASAFCLLAYDPYMILSVGFQLSYLAVLGIVSLQPGIYRLWEPTYWLWDEIWKISAVSIAAQLATFALGLYYFHQFPNYFLISNLFAIPGSFLVLIIGLVMMMVSFTSPAAAALGWLLEWIIKAMNGIIFSIEMIPFSLTENVYINPLQCWAIVLMIGLIYLWIQTKKRKYAVGLALLCLVFSLAQWKHFQEDVWVNKVTVYSIPGHSAIDFMENGHAYFLFDSALSGDAQKAKFHISPNRIKGGVAKVSPADPFIRQQEGCTVMVWKGRTIVQLYNEDFRIPPNLKVDYLIISNNAIKNLSAVVSVIEAKEFIVDSSNSFYRAERLLREAEKYGIEIFSVLHHGAFDLTI